MKSNPMKSGGAFRKKGRLRFQRNANLDLALALCALEYAGTGPLDPIPALPRIEDPSGPPVVPLGPARVDLESMLARDHPLRRMRDLADTVLERTRREAARQIDSPRIDPLELNRMLRALLVQVLYGVASDRALWEQMEYNLLWRWFVRKGREGGPWDPAAYAACRERLRGSRIAPRFVNSVLRRARRAGLLPDPQFRVDRSILKSWAPPGAARTHRKPPVEDRSAAGAGRLIHAALHRGLRTVDVLLKLGTPGRRLIARTFRWFAQSCAAIGLLKPNPETR
jgi:transposase